MCCTIVGQSFLRWSGFRNRGDQMSQRSRRAILAMSAAGLAMLLSATVAHADSTAHLVDTNWDLNDVGDFYGDGKADVILRNSTTGQDAGWLMDGAAVSTATMLPTWRTRTGRSSGN